jgi:hypothetical protein
LSGQTTQTNQKFSRMNISLITKNFGSQSINTDTFDPSRVSSSSTIFKAIEWIFNEWYEHNTQPGAPLGKDIICCYNGWGDGEPAIFSKRGAIIGGIENLIEYALESKKQVFNSRELRAIDIECAFEI